MKVALVVGIFLIALLAVGVTADYNDITGFAVAGLFKTVSKNTAAQLNAKATFDQIIKNIAIETGACDSTGKCKNGLPLSQQDVFLIIHTDGNLTKIKALKAYANNALFAPLKGKAGIYVLTPFGVKPESFIGTRGWTVVGGGSGSLAPTTNVLSDPEKKDCQGQKQNTLLANANARAGALSHANYIKNKVAAMIQPRSGQVSQDATCSANSCSVRSGSRIAALLEDFGTITVTPKPAGKDGKPNGYEVKLNGESMGETHRGVVTPDGGIIDQDGAYEEDGKTIAGGKGGDYVVTVGADGKATACTGDCQKTSTGTDTAPAGSATSNTNKLCDNEAGCGGSGSSQTLVILGHKLDSHVLQKNFGKAVKLRIGMISIPSDEANSPVVMPTLRPDRDPSTDPTSGGHATTLQTDPCAKGALLLPAAAAIQNVVADLVQDIDPSDTYILAPKINR